MMSGGGRRVAYYVPSWDRSIERLGHDDVAQVEDAVEKYVRDPTLPGLNRERIRDTAISLYSFRASKELRVLVNKEGEVEMLLEAGHHDDVYQRAKRITLLSHRDSGRLRYIEVGARRRDRPESAPAAVAPEPSTGGLLDHWSDEELSRAGIPAEALTLVRSVRSEDDLEDLDLEFALLLVDLIGQDFAEWSRPKLDPEAEAEQRLLAAFEDFGVLAGFTHFLEPAEARRLASAPIEDWMVYLHPEQRETVLRRYSGPAMVRGGPGTGKTVVALHRAVHLARTLPASEGPILFTTYLRNLAPVLSSLYGRIPGAPAGRVEFVGIDSLANRFLRKHGQEVPVERAAVNAALSSAFNRTGAAWGRFRGEGITRDYLRTEIAQVVKGRGLDHVGDYLPPFQRIGRRTPLQDAQRRAVWALREEWDAEMERRGTVDFVDRMRRARDVARALPEPAYRAAIVDEAQDFSEVGIQFVHALVDPGRRGDRPDSLLIVGDGAQRVYAGGFRPLGAGIDVRGRSTVLRLNFRTTRQIMEAALAVAGDVDVEDFEATRRRGEEVARSLREGPRPSLRMFEDEAHQQEHLIQRIRDVTGEGRGFGDILVATSTNEREKSIRSALVASGIPVEPLSDYDGVPSETVKVGTFDRSKGLEFKVVILPFLSESEFPRRAPDGQGTAERDEERQDGLSRLFVAMTRARDLLLLISATDVIDEIQRNEAFFEWR